MKHRWPIFAIVFATICVFARLIFADGGVPYRVIPWDFCSIGAPWLIYGWDMIRAGHWPLWCPFAGAGTPFFVNPQTHTYAPLSILLGLLFGYSYRLVQLQSVATIALAGIGAYVLSLAIWRSRSAALLSGLCFALSSSLFSHLEHFPILSGYALAPWMFWSILVTVERRSRWGTFAVASTVYSLLTGAYLGVVLMLIPWVALFACVLTFRQPLPNRERAAVLFKAALAGVIGAAMSAVNWLPFLASTSEYTRGEALGIEYVLDPTRSLAPKHFLGMLYSFVTSNPFPGVEVDISMRGIYFGAVAAVLAVACVLAVRQWIVSVLTTFTVGSLLMSLGGAFFLRVALHIAVPIFNMSRFPAGDSRYLAVLGLCLLAGGGALAVTRGGDAASTFALRAYKFLAIFYLISIVGLQLVFGKFIDVVTSTVTLEAFCMLLALIILARWQSSTAVLLLCAVAVLETGFAVSANFDIAGHIVSKADYRKMSHHETGFSKSEILQPRLGDESWLNGDASQGYVGKKFFVSDYNPLRLKRLMALAEAGFAGWLKNGPRVVALPAGSSPSTFAEFAPLAKTVTFDITDFGPNQMGYDIDVPPDSRLIFNEIYFPGWKASVDGTPSLVRPFNQGLRALEVGPGHHRIEFKFRPRLYFISLGISLAGLAAFLTWTFRLWRRRDFRPAAAA